MLVLRRENKGADFVSGDSVKRFHSELARDEALRRRLEDSCQSSLEDLVAFAAKERFTFTAAEFRAALGTAETGPIVLEDAQLAGVSGGTQEELPCPVCGGTDFRRFTIMGYVRCKTCGWDNLDRGRVGR